MKLKLIDVKTDKREITIGTCDWCMSVITANEPVFIFEKEDDTQIPVRGYHVDWFDYGEILVDNVIDFAAWISKQEFDVDTDFGYGWLHEIIWKYEEEAVAE